MLCDMTPVLRARVLDALRQSVGVRRTFGEGFRQSFRASSFFLSLTYALSIPAAERPIIKDAAEARAFRNRYLALTDGWAKETVFTTQEIKAMQDGKSRDELLDKGPDDPLGKQIRQAGEPSYEALSAVYPGKILDRTVLGTY